MQWGKCFYCKGLFLIWLGSMIPMKGGKRQPRGFPHSFAVGIQRKQCSSNMNDILYPQQRWKKPSKLVMGLTLWNRHTELISFASRQSKFIFYPERIFHSAVEKVCIASRLSTYTPVDNDSFVNMLSSVTKYEVWPPHPNYLPSWCQN